MSSVYVICCLTLETLQQTLLIFQLTQICTTSAFIKTLTSTFHCHYIELCGFQKACISSEIFPERRSRRGPPRDSFFFKPFFGNFWPVFMKGEKSCDRDSWHVLQLLRTPGGQDQEHISLIFRDLTAISPWTRFAFIRKRSCSWPAPPCPTSIFCPGEIDL